MIPLSAERDAFITRLRKRRTELGLSAEKAAERIGVESNALRNWEQGRSAPNLGYLLMWARALDCKVEVVAR